ncbi:tetratricopeptide repeat protein [Sphingobacterium spiritivorum]|uniref:tetratricopeptide repeat protein n=1 Tax=Sphingobacterium spiritivorum TaxID=258 RepID=UPI0019183F78|nr:hypothetical protein [Sphingobacterium spiritivorum]QQT27857.1 hypothetical protein I6J02_08440 [Sphingobacterium spiritivorum]
MKLLYLLFPFLMAGFYAESQELKLQSFTTRKQQLESILATEQTLPADTSQLKTYLLPIIRQADLDRDSSLRAAYYGLMADGYALFYDDINPKSTQLYLQSIRTASVNKKPDMELWAILNYAHYLYNYRDMSSALPLFMQAIEQINSLNPENILFPCESFKRIGYFLGTIGDYDESIVYLKRGEKYAASLFCDRAAIQDNIGQYLLKKQDTVSAEMYFKKALYTASRVNDEVRMGKAMGNMALIYQGRGQIDQAIRFVQQDLVYSTKHQSDQNTMYALILLGKLYLAAHQISDAEKVISEAEKYAVAKPYFKRSEYEIVRLRLDIALMQKDVQQELMARRRLEVLDDSLATSDGDMILKQTKWLAQKERYAHNIELARQRYEKEKFKKGTYLVLVIILLVIIGLIFNIFKRKNKARQDNYDKRILQLQVEKVLSDQRLLKANETMASYRSYMAEKNEQIDLLSKEIKQISKSSSPSLKQQKSQLQSLLDSHLMTEENWTNFKTAFQREYPFFLQQLRKNYPELTESNQRIILLLKLGLSHKEMSNMLGVTVDAVKKSRQRLRKKLGEKSDDLFNIVFDRDNSDSEVS